MSRYSFQLRERIMGETERSERFDGGESLESCEKLARLELSKYQRSSSADLYEGDKYIKTVHS